MKNVDDIHLNRRNSLHLDALRACMPPARREYTPPRKNGPSPISSIWAVTPVLDKYYNCAMNKAVDQCGKSTSDAPGQIVDAPDAKRPETNIGPISTDSSHRPSSNGNSADSPSGETPAAAANTWRHLFLNRSDQLFVAAAVSVMLALMLVHWFRLSGWGLEPVEIERLEPLEQTFRIDVNQATWVEWSQLDGVGQVLARRIVADRDERGPFRSIDDVQRVKGIGRKTLERLRPWLTIDQSAVDR